MQALLLPLLLLLLTQLLLTQLFVVLLHWQGGCCRPLFLVAALRLQRLAQLQVSSLLLLLLLLPLLLGAVCSAVTS